MPGCVLRVSGPYSKLKTTISESHFSFVESVMACRRRERGEASIHDRSTFNFTVSDADGGHVPMQISDLENFLALNTIELRRLRAATGVGDISLDFGWEIPRDWTLQWNTFPASLLKQCGELGIDLIVSVIGTAAKNENTEP